ncbi:hypothetical protein RND81_03G157500 [Saponaria officinalis]|uniref:F-box domain-containing protein n=1 Tax=Saponaria officinalis TaxID=3572 RepID=A0AAW1M7T4_SAPOF
MAVDWSSLPLDLICTIALNLETLEDFIYFSVVCRSWNHSSSLIKHQWRDSPVVPWLLLAENANEDSKSSREIFNLENNKCYRFNLPEMVEARCWGSTYGWVVIVDRDVNVQLFNPITKAHICFPSMRHLHPQPENMNDERYISFFLSFLLRKFIVVKISPDEFVIMVLYDSRKHLAFARHGDRSWTKVVSPKITDARMADFAIVNDNVFALYNDGALVYWNIKELIGGCGLVKPIDYVPSHPPEIFDELKKRVNKIYLVKSGSQLLMVLRYKQVVPNTERTYYDYETFAFDVYRLNSKDRKWEDVDEDFGDVALIVGNNSSMSIPITSSKSMHPRCIYFTDDESTMWGSSKEKSGHDMGVCDVDSQEIWKFYEGGNTGSLRCPPTCFIPQF